MEVKEKWVIVNPTHRAGQLIPKGSKWTNDSFHNLSRMFQAPLYHITDSNIPMHADVYHVCNFDVEHLDREIEFVNKVKANGAKVLVGFSQDLRFLTGSCLLNSRGTLYTSLCEVADGITSGCNPNLHLYGRYQNKVIDWGEILEPLDASMPYDERPIDFLTSGAIGEEALSFELELLCMIKEKYPDKRVVSCVHGIHYKLVKNLISRYPQIEFPFDFIKPLAGRPLIYYLQMTKTYCNPEHRPRPARVAIECYYCKVPFISSSSTYFSRLCEEFSYDRFDFKDILDRYDELLKCNVKDVINKMEERAKYDMFDSVYERARKKLGLY